MDVTPPPQWRDYVLAETFGYTPTQIDDQPAARLDWLLACHGISEQVKADRQREAQS